MEQWHRILLTETCPEPTIAHHIGTDRKRFKQLLNIFLQDDNAQITQRTARIIDLCLAKCPSLIQPHLPLLASQLHHNRSNGLKRNVLRLFQDTDLPEVLWDEVADCCFQFLEDSKAPIAVRVFSMTVLLNIVHHVPALKCALQLAIEEHLPHGSPGFVSRGKKVLKALEAIVAPDDYC